MIKLQILPSTLLLCSALLTSAPAWSDNNRDYTFHSYKGQQNHQHLNRHHNQGKPRWAAKKNAYKKGYKDGVKAARHHTKHRARHGSAYRKGYQSGKNTYYSNNRYYRGASYGSYSHSNRPLHYGYNRHYVSNDDVEDYYKWYMGTQVATELIRATGEGRQVNINRLMEIPLTSGYGYYIGK